MFRPITPEPKEFTLIDKIVFLLIAGWWLLFGYAIISFLVGF